ncbi:hydrogenase maturation protease, partial [bacterium]|nr:hydrogenase maturation protease [bacterium]
RDACGRPHAAGNLRVRFGKQAGEQQNLMNADSLRILIHGYGNPGRRDDGLGVVFSERMEAWAAGRGLSHIRTDCDYQLHIEDAAALAEADQVYFVDASRSDIDSFRLSGVEPEVRPGFTGHSVTPGYVLHLCEALYGRRPACFLLEIRGTDWEMGEGLSVEAARNLEQAFEFLCRRLAQGDIEPA